MYTLNLEGLVKDLKKVKGIPVEDPFPFLKKADRESGDFPVFYRLMTARMPEEIEDISLEQVVSLLPKLEKYSAYLEPRASVLRGMEERLLNTQSCCTRRRIL